MEFVFLYMEERVTLLLSCKCSSSSSTYFRILLVVFLFKSVWLCFSIQQNLAIYFNLNYHHFYNLTPYEQNRD